MVFTDNFANVRKKARPTPIICSHSELIDPNLGYQPLASGSTSAAASAGDVSGDAQGIREGDAPAGQLSGLCLERDRPSPSCIHRPAFRSNLAGRPAGA